MGVSVFKGTRLLTIISSLAPAEQYLNMLWRREKLIGVAYRKVNHYYYPIFTAALLVELLLGIEEYLSNQVTT